MDLFYIIKVTKKIQFRTFSKSILSTSTFVVSRDSVGISSFIITGPLKKNNKITFLVIDKLHYKA